MQAKNPAKSQRDKPAVPKGMFAQDNRTHQEEGGQTAFRSGGKTAIFTPKFPACLIRNEQGCSCTEIPVPSSSQAHATWGRLLPPARGRAVSGAGVGTEGEQVSAGETPLLDLRSLNDGNSSCLVLRSAGT